MSDQGARDKKTGRFLPGHSGNPSGVAKPKADAEDTRLDGWSSALTGIGDANRDKRMSHSFQAPALSYEDIIELWRGDDIARRSIETVPSECMREGYELTITDEGRFDDLKDAVEQKLSELGVDEAIERAFCYERAFGGGAIWLGVKDGRPVEQPLDISRVTSLEWLKVLEPIELYPDEYYDNPAEPKFGEPKLYKLNTSMMTAGIGMTGSTVRQAQQLERRIHESRLIVFNGLKVSNYQRSAATVTGSPWWGDSLLISLIEVLRDFNVAWHGAGIIATDFAQPVLSMENLMGLVAKQPEKVAARAAALEMQRSNARALLIDKNEEYERQSTSIAGLPDLLMQLSMRLSAALDMPLSLLMGNSPKGLGSDTENDVRFFYDRVKGIQKRKIGPVLRLFINIIMRTLRQRGIPKRWAVKFNPLWQLTDREKAEARLAQARVDSMYIKMGALTYDEVRFSRFGGEYSWDTQINENEPAPGIPEIQAQLELARIAAAAGPAPSEGGDKKSLSKPAGPSSHGVRGYARRNPIAPKITAAAKEGGDVAPTNRDAMGTLRLDSYAEIIDDVEKMRAAAASEYLRHRRVRDSADEVAYVRAQRTRLAVNKQLTPGIAALLDALEALARDDERFAHEAGECEPRCSYCGKADVLDVAMTETEICPECGDMMLEGKPHECGVGDD